MRYDLVKIMKRAWQIRKSTDSTMSAALKKSWAEAKAVQEKIYIKDWFADKMLAEKFQSGAYLIDTLGVEAETEKAYKLRIEVGYCSSIEFQASVWVPKSCTMTEDEKIEEELAQVERFEAGCRAYEKILAFAKENGLKVRKGMRKATLLAKIADAGLAFEA